MNNNYETGHLRASQRDFRFRQRLHADKVCIFFLKINIRYLTIRPSAALNTYKVGSFHWFPGDCRGTCGSASALEWHLL